MSVASNKHDLTGIQIYDKRDTQIPDVGLLRLKDLESGKERWIDTSLSSTRKALGKWWYDRQQTMTETMKRCRVDSTTIATDEDYVKALMALFRKRAAR